MLSYLVPRHLPPHLVQSRVANTSDFDVVLTLVTVADNWLVVAHDLPTHIEGLVQERLPRGTYPRAGGKRGAQGPPDPRHACIAWSLQRAVQCVPTASPLTLSTLLKSEFRLASAIMQCRSDAQVRHSVIAAYRRAGLPSLEEVRHTANQDQAEDQQLPDDPSSTKHWLMQMSTSLTTQTTIITDILNNQHFCATSADLQAVKADLTTQMNSRRPCSAL